MRRLPTDLEILDVTYERYYDTFASFTREAPAAAPAPAPSRRRQVVAGRISRSVSTSAPKVSAILRADTATR